MTKPSGKPVGRPKRSKSIKAATSQPRKTRNTRASSVEPVATCSDTADYLYVKTSSRVYRAIKMTDIMDDSPMKKVKKI